jgi:hypothetical protein
VLSYQLDQGLFVNFTGAEGVDHNRNRVRHPNGVSHLKLALFSQPGGHNILRDMAGGVAGRPVNLGRVLAGKGAPAVSGHAAVRINNDLPAGQAGVSLGAADYKPAGRVDKKPRVLIYKFRWDNLLNHLADHIFPDLRQADLGVMLG